MAALSPDGAEASGAAPVRLADLFKVFAMIGVSSFGGGLSGWMYRELVERLGWISVEDFLTGQSLARTLPGANVVNLSIWIGYRLRRSWGAAIAVSSVLAAPMVIIITLALFYGNWGHSLIAHRALLGVAAASLGISLSMGVRSLRTAAPTPFHAAIALFTFAGVGLLRWPMLPIVGVLTPVSLVWAFVVEGRRED